MMCEPTTALMIAQTGASAIAGWQQSNRQEAINSYNQVQAGNVYNNNMASLALSNQDIATSTNNDLNTQNREALRASSFVSVSGASRGVEGYSLDNAVRTINKDYNTDRASTLERANNRFAANAIRANRFANERQATEMNQRTPINKFGVLVGTGLSLGNAYLTHENRLRENE